MNRSVATVSKLLLAKKETLEFVIAVVAYLTKKKNIVFKTSRKTSKRIKKEYLNQHIAIYLKLT